MLRSFRDRGETPGSVKADESSRNGRAGRRKRRFVGWAILIAGSLLTGLVAVGDGEPTGVPESEPAADRQKQLMGFAVTSGAAPGYIEDRACAACHADIYQSYQQVGMSHSLYRPSARPAIETFDSDFVHEETGRHYRIRADGDRWTFRRWQVTEDGRETNVFERDIDWIIGSGNHSRTYHFRNSAGELYQLPLAWYSQENSWGMAPGFAGEEHPGVMRRVRRECMACHNAYPDVPAGSDVLGMPQWFPEELPQGTGCQRCHGPGADHVSKAMGGFALQDEVRAAIVNPVKLPVERRTDVCYQCHMQPSVVLPAVRRYGVGDYAFQPGEELSDQRLFIDIIEEGLEPSERFEINHHPYRLEQSPCFIESAGALSCLTCHDPHTKVAKSERIEHFRAACESCHQTDDCQLDAMMTAGTFENPTNISAADCTACHMPKRRTQDVVEVVMTDHLIRKQPGGPELVARLPERDPVVLEITPLRSSEAGSGHPTRLELASGVIRLAGNASSVDQLEGLLGQASGDSATTALDPMLDLLRGQLFVQRYEAADKTARSILKRSANHAQALEWLGLALVGQARYEEAAEVLARAEGLVDNRPEAAFNLGLARYAMGRWQPAAEAFRRSLALRENNPRAWLYLGQIEERQERLGEAKKAYENALSIEPAFDRAYVGLARVLRQQGDAAAAVRTLRHGIRWSENPGVVKAALDAAQSEPGSDTETVEEAAETSSQGR